MTKITGQIELKNQIQLNSPGHRFRFGGSLYGVKDSQSIPFSTSKGPVAMKKIVGFFLILGLLAVPASKSAMAGGYGAPGMGGGTVYGSGPYRPFGCGAGIYSAPWYLFYPYDNYFNMPAPPAYPYWPQQSLNGGAGAPNRGTMVPAAYFPAPGSVPNYWLGR